MTTRIIINGKEVTNPFSRALLILSAILITALVTAVVIFILLPLIGIAVTLSISFVLIFIVAAIVSVMSLALMMSISGKFFGTTDFRIERIHRRKH
ncbi:MAG: hypothetical protein KAT90_05900 [Gammaproteobacteria bacterium]|nr:hypothetical protein [Gammaproteobacteria bacterium]